MLKISVFDRATVALLLLLLLAVATIECRRVRLKPTPSSPVAAAGHSVDTNDQEEQPQAITRQVVFYAEPEDHNRQTDEEPEPVIIGSRQTSGYGRSLTTAVSNNNHNNNHHHHQSRLKADNSPKSPPVQTIRNFNKLNDDGSFTFGYEADDGSFKEETRGVDCVVRGKYGYVDPDGNKREFAYVSGNPCDPNAISQEEDEDLAAKGVDKSSNEQQSQERENVPLNIPTTRRPQNYALRPIQQRPKPTTTLFQQSFHNDESIANSEEEQDGQLQLNVKQPLGQIYRNNLALTDEDLPASQILRTATGKPRLAYHHQPSSDNSRYVTRPTVAATSTPILVDNQPATTYRPQIIQVPVTAVPPTFKQSSRPAYISGVGPSSTPSTYFDEQFKKYQLDTNLIPSSPGPIKTVSNGPIYSTELVYDPNTGQYNTIVYQQIPKLGPEINLRQKLPFVSSSTTTASPPYSKFLTTVAGLSSTTQTPFYQQQLIQQQQANQVQQSQQLYNLQIKQQQQQLQRFPQNAFVKPTAPPPHRQPQTFVQRYPPDAKAFQTADGPYPPFTAASQQQQQQQQQPFYYLSPSVTDDRQNIAAGQIEAFLRGHSLSF